MKRLYGLPSILRSVQSLNKYSPYLQTGNFRKVYQDHKRSYAGHRYHTLVLAYLSAEGSVSDVGPCEDRNCNAVVVYPWRKLWHQYIDTARIRPKEIVMGDNVRSLKCLVTKFTNTNG